MRTIDGHKLTEKEFRVLRDKLIKFYKTEKKCSSKCPFASKKWEFQFETTMEKLYHRLPMRSCICNIFNEFKANNTDCCPCNVYQEKAFLRLKRVIKKLKDPEFGTQHAA